MPEWLGLLTMFLARQLVDTIACRNSRQSVFDNFFFSAVDLRCVKLVMTIPEVSSQLQPN